MKEKFNDKWITEEDKKIMSIWGADDCYFPEEEIGLILAMTVEQLKDWLEDFSVREPEMYEYFRQCRKNFYSQKRYEDKVKSLSGDYLDIEFEWNREQEFITNNTNYSDVVTKRSMNKNVEDNKYYSDDNR